VLFSVDAPPVDAEGARAGVGASPGDERLLADEGRSLFTASVAARRPIEVGDRIELAVSTARLKYFDPDSGLALQPRPRALTATG
jgi:hypothetical protein